MRKCRFRTGKVSLSSVAFTEDVNGDGYADVIIGAPVYANGENAEGRAFFPPRCWPEKRFLVTVT